MAGFMTLGARPVLATADTSGQNTGNWTCVFDQSVISNTVPVFEMYHMYITSPQLTTTLTTAKVVLNTNFWDATLIGQLNSWDPAQPLLMTPGDTLYVMFNVPVATTPVPLVTAWFRYERP